eukprot:4619845-Prymnesium_polylepis.1
MRRAAHARIARRVRKRPGPRAARAAARCAIEGGSWIAARARPARPPPPSTPGSRPCGRCPACRRRPA